MDANRDGNSCQRCSFASSASSRKQGLQANNGELTKDSKLQQNKNKKNVVGERVPRPQHQQWLVRICPTTGGEIELNIPVTTTVEELKTVIARRLKLPIDRINLLYKERILKCGSLVQHGVVDGCKFTLLPNVETGLSTPKADNHSIMQVLENLSDRQVNEFLAGKAPLTLAMRLGEHMMFVQLQLSSSPFAMNKQPSNTSSSSINGSSHHYPNQILHHHHQPIASSSSSTRQHRHHHHHHPHRHLSPIQPIPHGHPHSPNRHYHPYQHGALPHPSIHQPQRYHRNHVLSTRPSEELRIPLPAEQMVQQTTPMRSKTNMSKEDSSTNSSVSCSSTSVPNFQHNHLKDILLKNSTTNQEDQQQNLSTPKGFRSPPTPTRMLSSPFDSPLSLSSGYTSSSPMSDCSVPSSPEATTPEASFSTSAARVDNATEQSFTRQQRKTKPVRLFPPPETETMRNSVEEKLQEFRQMSKTSSSSSHTTDTQKNSHESKTQKAATAESCQPGGKGAVIDSMYHMGRGIYSGTFSGTLNPTLQDGTGRPKRSLGTIVHILNDLLSAAPKGKLQVDSLSGGSVSAHTQQVWNNHGNHSPPRPAAPRVSGIRPLCGHVGCPEQPLSQPTKRLHKSQEDFSQLEKENQVMKDKVEQVQMMLQQRRQRRKAKREARASPYTWQLETGNSSDASQMKPASNKNSIDEVNVDSSCQSDNEDEMREHDAAFTTELKPEAVLV